MLTLTEFIILNFCDILLILVCIPLFCKSVKVDYKTDGAIVSAIIVIFVFLVSGGFLFVNNFSDNYISFKINKVGVSLEKTLSPEAGCTKYNILDGTKIVGDLTTCYITKTPTK